MTSRAHAAAAAEAGVRCAATAGSTTASTAAVDPKILFVIFINVPLGPEGRIALASVIDE
jgi:hypothetical protein